MRLVTTALLALTIAACGGAAAPPAPTGPTPVPTPSPSPTPATVTAECVESTAGLLEALQDIDARLNVGLTKVDYGTRVGDVRVAYERVDIADLDPLCISEMAIHLENALNEYVEANNAWSECFSDTDCDNDSVKPTLQEHWAEATRLIDLAEGAIPDA